MRERNWQSLKEEIVSGPPSEPTNGDGSEDTAPASIVKAGKSDASLRRRGEDPSDFV